MTSDMFLESCYFCGHRWGECTCQFTQDEVKFESDDTDIVEPNIDESGRFFVDPVRYYGQDFLDWQKENPQWKRKTPPNGSTST